MTTQSRLLWLLFAVNLAVAAAGVALWRHVIWSERLAAVDQMLRDKVVIFTRSIPSDQPLYWPDVDVELETRTFPLVRLVYQPDGIQVRQLPATGETLFLREATRKAAIETRAQVMETIDGGRLGPLRVATYPKWRWGTPEEGPLVDFLGQLLLPLRPLEKTMARDTWAAAGVALAWVAVAQGLLAWGLRRWRRGLARVAATAQDLSREESPRQRLPVDESEPDLAAFARACNGLLDRLEHLHESRHRFLADAAHELRTPLAVMLGELEVALRRERDPARYQTVLESNREEIIRLTKLAEGLLLLARVDAAPPMTASETTDLAALVSEVVSAAQARAPQARLMVNAPAHLAVPGPPHLLRPILTNLLDNALRHSPEDEPVEVALTTQDGEALLQVTDHGPGLAPEHLPRLFDRFYRVDSARHRAQGGAGLGLAIVRRLATAAGGSVAVHSELGRGCVFTVRLPQAPTGPPSADEIHR